MYAALDCKRPMTRFSVGSSKCTYVDVCLRNVNQYYRKKKNYFRTILKSMLISASIQSQKQYQIYAEINKVHLVPLTKSEKNI